MDSGEFLYVRGVLQQRNDRKRSVRHRASGSQNTGQERRITLRVILHLHIDQNMGLFEVLSRSVALMIYEAELSWKDIIIDKQCHIYEKPRRMFSVGA